MGRKDVERLFLDEFLRRVKWPVIEVTPSEEPDFLVKTDGGLLGVELTQIFKNTSKAGSPNKAKESARSQFLRRLADEYCRRDDRPIRVQAIFPEPLPHFGVIELVDRIRRAVPGVDWEQAEVKIRSQSGALLKLFVRRLPASCGRYRLWSVVNNSVGWVRSIDSNALRTRIGAKARRLSSYGRAVDRICLVIVADNTHESGMFSWKPMPLFPASGFEAVYLYLHPTKVIQIAASSRPIDGARTRKTEVPTL